MDRLQRFLVLLIKLSFFTLVRAETFSVKIHTENHVNQVDSRFISFTVDPKHLFSSNGKFKDKDSTCMAASLAPAYIRIAGPSTFHITFHNTSMSIDDSLELPEPSKQKRHTQKRLLDSEEKDDVLSKLKKFGKGRLARSKRDALDSQETEKLKMDSNESVASTDDIASKVKKLSKDQDRLARKKKKTLIESQETDNHKKDGNESSQRNDDILSKLKKSSQDRLAKKQKKPLSDSNDTENQKEDSPENTKSNDDILSKLKNSKSDRLARKQKKILPDGQETEYHKKDSFDGIQSTDDILSKLKKSTQDRVTRIQRKPLQDSQEDHKNDSHESIFSKLKKSKGKGLLKLKQDKHLEEVSNRNRLRRSGHGEHLEVHHRQWQRFIQWAESTGFDLVFAVNNGEKTETGMWDPNPAMNMLTIAEKDNVSDIFWQLGYECSNQTIEDYLNDLETLRVMVDTFGRNWRVVGGDITNCLQEGSKSDFKDYVMLSTETMDAVLLNGNSSSRELERMSPTSRLALLRSLSSSPTPLWLTERPQRLSETERAADWLTSLGYSARNGFDVHFRELAENELYEPTLSFYMALLFKNLVGERVLDVTTDPSEGNAAVFAHCTSLRHKAVPGAVTIYGVNMDEEAARFAVKLSRREEGGDIMQFILGHDVNGNIVVNGRPMFYEGDIRPVVKRVRPYKTLLLNLPPKTFGFWVLANTKVDACYDYKEKDNITLVEAKPVNTREDTKNDASEEDENKSLDDVKKHRARRSLNEDDFAINFNGIDNDEAVVNRIEGINRGLRELKGIFGNDLQQRAKRQLYDDDFENRKIRRLGLKKIRHEHKLPSSGIFEKIMNNINLPKLNLTKNLKELRLKSRINKNKQFKRHSRNYRNKEDAHDDDKEYLSRSKRSVFPKHNKIESEERTEENEVDFDEKPVKFGKILHRQEKIKKTIEKHDETKSNEDNADEIEINTKLTNDDAVFKITENADHGLLKNTFENVLSVLEELNHNLNKIWTALSILD